MYGVKVSAQDTFGDDNNGLPFGVEYYETKTQAFEGIEFVDIEWFKTEAVRAQKTKGITLIR